MKRSTEPYSHHPCRQPDPAAERSCRSSRRSATASAYDEAAQRRCLTESVAEVVRHQAEAGVDVVSDGEFGKSISWSQYVLERLSGFERRPRRHRSLCQGRRPRALRRILCRAGRPRRPRRKPVRFRLRRPHHLYRPGRAAARHRQFQGGARRASKVAEAFLPVAAPASVIPDRKNEYYKTEDELDRRHRRRDAHRIQDDRRCRVCWCSSTTRAPPSPSTAWCRRRASTEYHKWVGRHVEAMNHALEGIPEDRVRYHVCWGSWPGPHTTDVPLEGHRRSHPQGQGAAPMSSRAPIRATSMNGGCGKASSCRRARC